MIDPAQWPLAQLTPNVEALLRIGYGALLFLQLAVLTAAQAHRFFTTERYGGYIESTPSRDRWIRPPVLTRSWRFGSSARSESRRAGSSCRAR